MPDTLPTGTTPILGRRSVLGGAAALAASAALGACSTPAGPGPAPAAGDTVAPRPHDQLGSIAGAPNLPPEFTDTFTSRYVDTGSLRQHAAVGGNGPPLLLVHGWPQTRCAWRLLMPTLARDFQVVAIDQRGIFTAPDRQHPAHDKLWRLAFNRVTDVNEQLVKKREHMVSSDPDALRGSFD